MPRDEACSRLLLADDVDDVLAVEVARLPEEGLLTVVVVFLAVLEVVVDPAVRPVRVPRRAHHHVLGVANGPAGERPRALLDVVLRVVAHSHGEQLQQFAAPVLVYCVLVVVLVVQPDDHRRVLRELQQQPVESAHSVAPEHIHLVRQHPAVDDLREARGENAVPEQSHLLLQWSGGGYHAVQPPARRPGVIDHPRCLVVEAPHYEVAEPLGIAGIQQFIYGGFVSTFDTLLDLGLGRPKARTAHQVRHKLDVLFVPVLGAHRITSGTACAHA